MVEAKTDFEDVSQYALSDARRDLILSTQTECSVIWSTTDGWPVGVMHRFVFKDDTFWATCTSQRKRVPALRKRPKSCVIVSAEHVPGLGYDQSITAKTLCTVHDDRETKDWFYPALGARMSPNNEAGAAGFASMLDSPNRVVMELKVEKWILYDGRKVGAHVAGTWEPGMDFPNDV